MEHIQDKYELNQKTVNWIKKEALEMISYVSTSQNGNRVPERAKKHAELLWVRFADRLEAIGPIGAVRCWQYTCEKMDRPFATTNTPRPTTEEQVFEYAS